jgi:aryl-alcohol dehydrogenase-like predicted oxidoreductase
MQSRQLGADGFQVSEVGLGCWQFGGDFGAIADDTAISIMAAAVDSGVTFFDTANVYGNGRSESLIGRFMHESGHAASGRVRVATKYGRGPDAYPDRYSLAGMRQAVTQSMMRLRVQRIDLLQLHCVPTEVLNDGEIFQWLRQLKTEGLIEQFGASVESVAEGLVCLQQPGLMSLQVIFNLLRQKLVTELLPQAAARGVGVIVRLPLASGLLSGKFDATTVFAPEDHRHYNRDGQHFNVGETFAGLPLDVGISLVNQLKEHFPDRTLTEISLRWILDHPAVSTVIPGASRPDQARFNASTSDLKPLDAQTHQQLKDFYEQHVADKIRGPY